MSKANDEVRRVLDLISFLQRHGGRTEAEVAVLLGCSEAEVGPLLDQILMCGTPPYSPRDYVCVFREGGRIRLEFAEHFRRPVNFTPQEVASLLVLLDDPLLVSMPHDTERAVGPGAGPDATVGADADADTDPHSDHLTTARDALRARLRALLPGATDRADTGTGDPNVPIHVDHPGLLARRHTRALQDAIQRRRRIRLDVFSASRFALATRVVSPYRLLRHGDLVYLLGFDHTFREKLVHFRVDRIRTLAILDSPAAEPDLDALEAELASDIRPRATPGGSLATVWFAARVVPYIREIFAEKRLRIDEDGSVTLRLPLVNANWLTRFVLSYGDEATILEPASLRRQLRDLATAAAARQS